MTEKKEICRHVFTVEGETEKWYLDWLQKCINSEPKTLFIVEIVSSVEQRPMKYAKRVNPLSTPKITHLCDYENNDNECIKRFISVLDQLKLANSITGKSFHYDLGYSNFTFELWMILHKQDCNSPMTDRSQYLGPINKAYHENFTSLKQYKEERNFKRCLSKLSLNNVMKAVERSKKIMESNERNGLQERKYKGFRYYQENPSLTIWKAIADILQECGLNYRN